MEFDYHLLSYLINDFFLDSICSINQLITIINQLLILLEKNLVRLLPNLSWVTSRVNHQWIKFLCQSTDTLIPTTLRLNSYSAKRFYISWTTLSTGISQYWLIRTYTTKKPSLWDFNHCPIFTLTKQNLHLFWAYSSRTLSLFDIQSQSWATKTNHMSNIQSSLICLDF